jgi:hypothetical protein
MSLSAVPGVPADLHGSIDESDLEGPATTKSLTELKADDDFNPIGVMMDEHEASDDVILAVVLAATNKKI